MQRPPSISRPINDINGLNCETKRLLRRIVQWLLVVRLPWIIHRDCWILNIHSFVRFIPSIPDYSTPFHHLIGCVYFREGWFLTITTWILSFLREFKDWDLFELIRNCLYGSLFGFSFFFSFFLFWRTNKVETKVFTVYSTWNLFELNFAQER